MQREGERHTQKEREREREGKGRGGKEFDMKIQSNFYLAQKGPKPRARQKHRTSPYDNGRRFYDYFQNPIDVINSS